MSLLDEAYSCSEVHYYLNSFIRKFGMICLDETWLNASDNIDLFQLFRYKNC